jgi:putative ABC transport system permease protein
MKWRKRDRDRELDRELQFHLEKLIQEKMAAGLSPEEARRQAALEFGGNAQLKEELRDVYRIRLLETARQNLRAALRFLIKSPSFSITIIATLTLGIGANTAVFSAIDAVLLRPLPFPDSGRLVQVNQNMKRSVAATTFVPVAPLRLEDWNRMNSTFQGITGSCCEACKRWAGSRRASIRLTY